MSSLPGPSQRDAFTLVEVVLALGVVSFALIALLGLFTAEYQSTSSAKQDTAIAQMSQHVLALLKEQPQSLAASFTTNYFFDADGNPLPSTTGAVFDVSTVNIAPTGIANVGTNMVNVQLKVSWPWPVTNQTLIVNASRANLQ